MAEVRTTTANRILTGLGADGQRPATRAAVHGWLGFLDGAILDWIAHDDLTREELHGMLLGAFAGALIASGASGGLPTEPLPAWRCSRRPVNRRSGPPQVRRSRPAPSARRSACRR